MAGQEQTEAKHATQVKLRVAWSSVFAALLLTGLKLGVGLWSNSLGLLSEAAHSALDLMAALLTLYAIWVSIRPPDQNYQYGQTKIENLSAVMQAALLMITCGWIIYEALDRLLFHQSQVEAEFWVALVLLISMAVDYSRARILGRAALLYKSQALEADAMHFSTDVWSSLVVFIGIGGVWLARQLPDGSAVRATLLHADSLAALLVAGVVLVVSLRLGLRGANVLMDRAPSGISNLIRQAVVAVPEVLSIKRLRVRQSGPQIFVDMNLGVSQDASLERSHRVAYLAEQAALAVAPGADIVVQVEPANDRARGIIGKVRSVAARQSVKVHSIRTSLVRDQLLLELHAEIDDQTPLEEAHRIISFLETQIRAVLEGNCRIFTHIEPAGKTGRDLAPSTVLTIEAIQRALDSMPESIAKVTDCHNIVLYDDPKRPSLSFHCRVDSEKTVVAVHDMTEDIEIFLRRNFPRLGRILIHAEPRRQAS